MPNALYRRSIQRILVVFLSMHALLAVAQVTTGTISGTVRDGTGAVVPGIIVTVRNGDTGISRTVSTDREGRYRAPSLSLGTYEVQAESAGFQTAVRSGIHLTVGREAVVDLTMEVGQVTERVEVTGEASLVETTSSTVAGLVDDRTIRDLPLNARSFAELALLQMGAFGPKVVSSGSMVAGMGTAISMSGARPQSNSFLLDGTDINDAIGGTPGGVSGATLGVETVREFSVLTSAFSAEFGRSSGGVINAVSRSGTNDLRGNVFEYLRNSALDARNFFAAEKDPFKRNQFGFTAGGPIRRDKTFFYGSYEGLRERLGLTRLPIVPDELTRQGLLFDPQNPGQRRNVGISPAVKPYFDLYPLPNLDIRNGLGTFRFSQSQPTDQDYFMVKMDHHFTDRHSFFTRYTFDDGFQNGLGSIPTLGRQFNANRNQYLTIEEGWIISPTLLNTFRAAFNRSALSNDISPTDVDPALSYVPGQPFGEFNVGGLTGLGPSFIPPRIFISNVFQFTDNLFYTTGRHSLKFGVNVQRIQVNGNSAADVRGRYTFETIELALRGTPRDFRAVLPGTDGIRGLRQNLLGFFVQEDLRVSPALTLNLGLRYEFVTVPTEVNGKVANLHHPLDLATTVGDPFFNNPSLKNFAPRIGFAWNVLGDGKTSLRGGFGIYHDQILPIYYRDPFARQDPFYQVGEVRGTAASPITDFPRTFNSFVEGRFTPNLSLFSVDADLKQPYMMQYNLTLQRQLAPTTVVTAAYTGSRGVHLARFTDNTAVPEIRPDGRKFFEAGLTRRNRTYFQTRWKTTDASSFYNSFQLSLNRKFNRGFQFQASYMFSKSIDDSSQQVGQGEFDNTMDQITTDPDDPKADRGLSGFDVRHNLVINSTYDLPFGSGKRWGSNLTGVADRVSSGWQINSIATLSTGFPVNIRMGFNRSRNLAPSIVDRPDLVAGRSNNPVLGGPIQYWDPGAFQLPPVGFLGNLARGTGIGPGFATVDFSLVKNTWVTEQTSLQFRAEFFNLFNRVNLGVPERIIFRSASGVPDANFGRIRGIKGTARQIQFGLKFLF